MLSRWSGFFSLLNHSVSHGRGQPTRPLAALLRPVYTCATRLSLSHSFSLASRSHVHSLSTSTLVSSLSHGVQLSPPPSTAAPQTASSPPSLNETPMCCRCLLAASWMNRSASAGVHSLTVDAFLACVTPKHLCAVPMSSRRNVVVMNCGSALLQSLLPPLPPPSASAASAAAASADVWHCLATMAARAARWVASKAASISSKM